MIINNDINNNKYAYALYVYLSVICVWYLQYVFKYTVHNHHVNENVKYVSAMYKIVYFLQSMIGYVINKLQVNWLWSSATIIL